MEMQTLGLVHKSNPLTFNFLFGLIFWHSGQQPRIQSKIRAYNGRWGLHAVLQGWLGWHFGQHDHTKTPKWEYQFFVSNLLIVGQLPRTHTIWGLAISCHRFRLMKGILARSILRLKHTVKKLQMKREKSIKWFSFGHLSWITKKSVCQHGNKPNQKHGLSTVIFLLPSTESPPCSVWIRPSTAHCCITQLVSILCIHPLTVTWTHVAIALLVEIQTNSSFGLVFASFESIQGSIGIGTL